MTPEQLEALRAYQREAQRKRRAKMTPEEKEAYNAKAREYAANMTPEQKEAYNAKAKERRANMTPEQKEARNARQRDLYRQKKEGR